MELRLAPLQTARLRLEPLTAETARAILVGDLSGLAAASSSTMLSPATVTCRTPAGMNTNSTPAGSR
jgi:hypothetical protein